MEFHKQMIATRFPPLFTPVRLRERVDALAWAAAHAGEDGAGTIYQVGRFDLIEFAVVFEPEQPLSAARRVLFAGMNALADAIADEALPERGVRFEYPSTIIFDDGLIGGARLAWPEGVGDGDVPAWIVFSAMIRSGGLAGIGLAMRQTVTTLEEAGFQDIDAEAFSARFCRHLMVEIDEWHSLGFKGVGARYLNRLGGGDDEVLRVIEPNGDLSVQRKGNGVRERRLFAEEVAHAAWFDPALQGPKL